MKTLATYSLVWIVAGLVNAEDDSYVSIWEHTLESRERRG